MSTALSTALWALGAIVMLALATWLVSLIRHDVSIVDSVWSLMVAVGGAVYAAELGADTTRAQVVCALAVLWAARLALYITVRNWGHGEDRRYQAIRTRNEPHFAFKSLYLVFVLQAVLAWVVSLSLLASLQGGSAWGWLDTLGAVLVLFGIAFETIADFQMSRFKASPANHGQVMDRGLWRYSRHPNYFGECCVWWGFYLFALGAGGWWALVSMISPILMTFLLLKVSGVALLEADIGERRPPYRDYIRRTNAFFPGPLKS
jgi:steroid 5-alpha reductase family enzyme